MMKAQARPQQGPEMGGHVTLGVLDGGAAPGQHCLCPCSTCMPATQGCPSDGRSWTSASHYTPTTRPFSRRWLLCLGLTTDRRLRQGWSVPGPWRLRLHGCSCGPRQTRALGDVVWGSATPHCQLESPTRRVCNQKAVARRPERGAKAGDRLALVTLHFLRVVVATGPHQPSLPLLSRQVAGPGTGSPGSFGSGQSQVLPADAVVRSRSPTRGASA